MSKKTGNNVIQGIKMRAYGKAYVDLYYHDDSKVGLLWRTSK